ncbi:preprotein translocase subunit SecA [Candidatus Nomurabacteria bacterium]|nr:preprotein translocase subunit SecA [Candidatus Nomurabacteria bacterium]
MPFWSKIFGDQSTGYIKTLGPIVARINELEAEFSTLDLAGFPSKTAAFRQRLTDGETLDDLLPEAFALVREASRRTLNQRHYDVQLLGGVILHQGKIAEMKTGEGKTLVSTLPAYLNALTGRGVHLVTVNDYLSRRDAVWMGQIYAALGLSVGVINHETSFLYDPGHKEVDEKRDAEGLFRVFYEFLKPCSRREAYAADITYGTNNEFGFDYLRDNLSRNPEQVSQISLPERSYHNFAIVDEVDSILIDEARTPLIISAPVADADSLYMQFAQIAKGFTRDTDYTTEEKSKTIALLDEGISRAEKSLGVENIYTDKGIKYVHHLETAVRAQALFERDRDYVVRGGEVVIVDEFTGRLQPGRRWSEGLHQAIEAKEGVMVKQESRTLASVTFQNYFKLYRKVAGMTGTALTSAEEFLRVYGLDTIAVPTHRSNARRDLNDLIFQTEKGKIQAVVRKIKAINETGQPVLVGTISIEKNEMLAAYLKREGIAHNLLNAKNNEQEGAIIAEAGRRGSVVIATNMAGRGVDIKLGGPSASEMEREEIKKLGGLYVIGTERHEARRIDNQLRGRAGRQGDPGVTQFFISLEDDLARVFAAERIKGMMGRFGIPEDEPIEARLVSRAIEGAQGKIEGLNFDVRKHLLDYDNVLNHQRTTIYERRRRLLFGDIVFLDEWLLNSLPEAQVLDQEKKLLLCRAILQVIDLNWLEHLEAMEYMRSSVGLRAYGQRDPLVEYKREGLKMFKEMESNILEEIKRLLPNIGEGFKDEVTVPLATVASGNPTEVGRNDLCPCGSGKKYKKCHGK